MSYLPTLHGDYSDFFSLVDVWSPDTLQPAQIFDDVAMAATVGCSCYVINTGEGLILMDAMLPVPSCREAIVAAIECAGWSLSDLKLIFITHGHFDHTGVAGELARETGAKICFPEGDYELWTSERNVRMTRKALARRGFDSENFVPDFVPDRFLKDGDEITLGHTTVRCAATPGHTPGCMTYIFNVTDRGEPHTAVMMGGTLPQRTKEEIGAQLESLELVRRLTDELSIDVELSNHHPLQCGEARMEFCRKRLMHLPNPFVVGREGIFSALDEYARLCDVFLKVL